MKTLRRLALPALGALACVLIPARPAAAQDALDGLCPVLLHQERIDLEDLELEVSAEETRLRVADELFVLVDEMWRNDLFQRLPYLGVKHRRDAARIALDRARQQLERQQAVVAQYSLACSDSSADGPPSDVPQTLEEALEQYLAADCAVRALDLQAYEVDLEYYREVAQSSRDLRSSDIASRQQVLFAEQDVELTEQLLAQAQQRVARCRQ
ncbi:MAG: hypothetical protein PVJ49_04645 [Acidobacteriota bacterium]|jgi:hypothetical protein